MVTAASMLNELYQITSPRDATTTTSPLGSNLGACIAQKGAHKQHTGALLLTHRTRAAAKAAAAAPPAAAQPIAPQATKEATTSNHASAATFPAALNRVAAVPLMHARTPETPLGSPLLAPPAAKSPPADPAAPAPAAKARSTAAPGQTAAAGVLSPEPNPEPVPAGATPPTAMPQAAARDRRPSRTCANNTTLGAQRPADKTILLDRNRRVILRSSSLSLPLRFASTCFNPPITKGNVRHVTVEVRVPVDDLPTLPEALQHKGGRAESGNSARGCSTGAGAGAGADSGAGVGVGRDHDLWGLSNSSGNETAAAADKGSEVDVRGMKAATAAAAAGGSSPSSEEQPCTTSSSPARVVEIAANDGITLCAPPAAAAPAAAATAAAATAPATAMFMAGKAAADRETTTSPSSPAAAPAVPPSTCHKRSMRLQQQGKQCMAWEAVLSFQGHLKVIVDSNQLGTHRLQLYEAGALIPFEGWKFWAVEAVSGGTTQPERSVSFSVVHLLWALQA